MAEQVTLGTQEICSLMDAVENKLNSPFDTSRRVRFIFECVLGKSPETLELMFRFTKDVRTCPLNVVIWCQEFLSKPS